MTRVRLLAALVGLAALVAPAAAQSTYTWQPTASSTWNVAANWLDQLNNPGAPVGANNTTLVFNASGTQSYTATNDIGAGTFSLNNLTVNNTGSGTVTITGATTANTLTFAGTTPTLDITGTVLFNGLFANASTLRKVGTGTFIHDSNNAAFTGTLTIDGGTFVNRATTNATTNFNPVSIVVNSGGIYQFGENTVGDPNLPNSTYVTINSGGRVNWQEGETTGGIHLSGGTLDLQQGSITTATNTGSANVMNWTSGTVTGTGATAFAVAGALPISKTTAGTVTIQGNASVTTTGLFTIADGTVSHVAAGNLGTSNIALGGATAGTTVGTFEYQGASASRAGTFAVNAGGGTIAVTNATTTLTLSGAFSGAGNLSKTGAGTLALTGTLGGTGTTTAAGGTLRVNPVTAAGGFVVTDGGTLAVNSGTGAAGFSTPTLTLGGAASVVRFDLNTASAPSGSLLTVSTANGLTTSGSTLAVTNQQPLANGTYTLIGYTGTQLSSGFALQLPGRAVGSLDYSATGKVNAVVTGNDTIVWGGQANGTWDIGTGVNVGGTNNWRLASNNADTNFIQTDTVAFGNTGAGTVTISGTVQPSAVAVNATANYTFGGSGGIGGTSSLTKGGSGTLTINTANSYTGATAVTGGTLTVGTGGSIGGSSSLAVSGGGIVNVASLANLNTAAPISLNAGTLAVTADSASSGTQVITVGSGGGTLDVGGGAVVSVLGTQLLGPGNTLTKAGGGTLTIGSSGTATVGTYQVTAGALRMTSNRTTATAAVSVASGGTFYNLDTTSFTAAAPLVFGSLALNGGDGATLSGVSGNANILGTTTGSGAYLHTLDEAGSSAAGINVPVTLTGQNRFTQLNVRAGANVADTVTDTFTGVISGTGGITKDGNGTMLVSSASTYSGATVVENGTFGLTGSGSINSTPTVTVNAGGKFSVSGLTGAYTLGSANAQTLQGTGTVVGGVTVGANGTVRGDSGTGTGTLTTGNVTVASGGRLGARLGTGTAASSLNTSAGVLDLNSGAIIAPSGTFDGGGDRVLATLSPSAGGLVVNGTPVDTDGTIGTYTFQTGDNGVKAFDGTSGLQIDLAGVSLNQGEQLVLSRTGNTLVLSFTPVPEPALLLAACGLVAGGVVGVRKLRRAKKS